MTCYIPSILIIAFLNSSDLERVVCGLLQITLERPNRKEAFE